MKDFYVGKNRLRNYHIMINYIENILMALDVNLEHGWTICKTETILKAEDVI